VSTAAQDSAPQTIPATMRIVINGEPRDVPPNLTLLQFIRFLQLDPERIAVEMNRHIVKRDNWSATVLMEGATLEIVQFVGGG